MVNLLIKNITNQELKVSYRLNGDEIKTVLKPNDFVISEQPITALVKILERRGFVYMETANEVAYVTELPTPIQEETIETELPEPQIQEEVIEVTSEVAKKPIKEQLVKQPEIKKKKARPDAWTKKELDFLKRYYSKYGTKFCIVQLSSTRTPIAVQGKIKELKLVRTARMTKTKKKKE